MNHKEYIRITGNKKTAVLMIHGILGTPRHFDRFLDVIPKDCDIFNLLLDGHGKGVTDFSHTSMKKWKRQVLRQMSRLDKEYEEIIILAHSLGTLLGIMASFAYPDKVKHMILLNVPLNIHVTPSVITNIIQILFKKTDRNPNSANMKMSGSVEITLKLWQYIGWIPRFLELFVLIGQTKERISLIRIPTHTFHSRKDELVSNRAILYLESHPYIENYVMEHSGHFGYAKEDLEVIRETIRQSI